jgi:hypothetical protein
MTGLEGIVRPFESGDVSPAKPSPQSGAASPADNTVIEIGKNGTVKTLNGTFSLDITWYFVKKPKEKEQEED